MYITETELFKFIDDFKPLSIIDKLNVLKLLKNSLSDLNFNLGLIQTETADAYTMRDLETNNEYDLGVIDDSIRDFNENFAKLHYSICKAREKITAMETIIALEQKDTK